eukprot:gene13741-biopygen11093
MTCPFCGGKYLVQYQGHGIVRINSYMVMWFPPWGHRPPEHEVNLLGEADPETRVPRDSTQTRTAPGRLHRGVKNDQQRGQSDEGTTTGSGWGGEPNQHSAS